MTRLLLLECLAALTMATSNAQSPTPIATLPVISTATVSAVSESLSASFSTFTYIVTSTLQSSVLISGSPLTIYSGVDYSTYTATSVVLSAIAQYVTITSTIGSTTLFGTAPTANPRNSSTTRSAVGIVSPPAATLSTGPESTKSQASALSSTTPVFGTSGTVANAKHLSGGAKAGIFVGVAFITLSVAAAIFLYSGKIRTRRRRRAERKSWRPADQGDFFAPAGIMMSENKRLSAVNERERSQAWPAAEMNELRANWELDQRASPGGVEKRDSTLLAPQLPPLHHMGMGKEFVWDRPRSTQSLTALPRWSWKRWK